MPYGARSQIHRSSATPVGQQLSFIEFLDITGVSRHPASRAVFFAPGAYDAVILVYDCSNSKSHQNLVKWVREVALASAHAPASGLSHPYPHHHHHHHHHHGSATPLLPGTPIASTPGGSHAAFELDLKVGPTPDAVFLSGAHAGTAPASALSAGPPLPVPLLIVGTKRDLVEPGGRFLPDRRLANEWDCPAIEISTRPRPRALAPAAAPPDPAAGGDYLDLNASSEDHANHAFFDVFFDRVVASKAAGAMPSMPSLDGAGSSAGGLGAVGGGGGGSPYPSRLLSTHHSAFSASSPLSSTAGPHGSDHSLVYGADRYGGDRYASDGGSLHAHGPAHGLTPAVSRSSAILHGGGGGGTVGSATGGFPTAALGPPSAGRSLHGHHHHRHHDAHHGTPPGRTPPARGATPRERGVTPGSASAASAAAAAADHSPLAASHAISPQPAGAGRWAAANGRRRGARVRGQASEIAADRKKEGDGTDAEEYGGAGGIAELEGEPALVARRADFVDQQQRREREAGQQRGSGGGRIGAPRHQRVDKR
ncbi:hypothetical protein CXG81DRAFT_17609 [Caulochytrium protostelioides]|uniref:Uncharacterized protein n=1 Tax=Caulochytrium protostelioides TaxID=1555241 RepID=A0A4P9XBG7_9FUNG|nr:hypothetical protein CXG81DRAFT_17609 [Caulochytrium protostelioides]|eukprot:RKP02722.1 hypothetical protein CXG81DRAFT_17609 [Caulochytrium protostelioides]